MVVAATGNSKQRRSPTAHEERVYKVQSPGPHAASHGAGMVCLKSSSYTRLQVCSLIPKGKVSTYGSLATILKSSPRAVGQVRQLQIACPLSSCHYASLCLRYHMALLPSCIFLASSSCAIHMLSGKHHAAHVGSAAESFCTRGSMPPCSQ